MSSYTSNPDRQPPENPLISILCISKDHGEYIEDMIFSVLGQKYENFEFIVSDGGSTDNSLDILKSNKFITLLPGKDCSRFDGLMRALAAARGRYVMFTTPSDGYLSRDWFNTVSTILEKSPQISMVYGASAGMTAEGTLLNLNFPGRCGFTEQPQKEKFAETWVMKGFHYSYLPELNYCMRMDLFRKLTGPSEDFPELNDIDPLLRAHFEFNRLGYLSYYVPAVANFGRTHPDQSQFSETNQNHLRVYETAWQKYHDDILAGRKQHVLRDGRGEVIAKVAINQVA